MHHLVRLAVAVLGAVIALLLFGPGVSPAGADSHCRGGLGQGWASGLGRGMIIMKNTGQPCTVTFYANPEFNLAADTLAVVTPPQNGVVTISIPRASYLPNAGFTGRDRFEISGAGPGRGGRRVTIRGELVVQVNP